MPGALYKQAAFSVAFLLMLFCGLLVGSCNSNEQPEDGDEDLAADADIDTVGENVQKCYDFCDKRYECDQTGIFTEDEQSACYQICNDVKSNCLGDRLIDCGLENRCDEFNTCFIRYLESSDCELWVDGDYDSENTGYAAKLDTVETLNFGAVVKGQSNDKYLSLYNVGLNVLEIYGILIVGNSAEFEVEYSGEETLYVYQDDFAEIKITYSPVDGGKDQATLLIYSNSQPDRIREVLLESDYKGLANISVDKTEVDFGDVNVGSVSDVKNIRITNVPQSSSDNRLLTINDIVIANQSSGSFDFSTSSPKPPFTIVPDAYVDISLVFSPQSSGEVADVLTISSDSYLEEDKNLEIDLIGEGTARKLCFYPEMIAFGSVKVNGEAKRTLEIEACGSADVTVSEISFAGSDSFSLDNVPTIEEGGLNIAAGESVVIGIYFRPTSIIAKSANVTVKSNDIFFDSTQVPINGQGAISNLVLSPPYLSFGDVALGGDKSISINLSNSGSWPLNVTGATFESGGNTTFSIENADSIFPLSLDAAGGEYELNVVFTPTESGSAFDNLTFESDNSAGNLTAGLSGRGTRSEVTLSPSGTLEFTNVQLGTSRNVVLTVTNTGTAALTVQDYSITEGNDVFGASEVVETVLQQNVSKDITVSFTPDEIGEESGKLVLKTDATLEEQRNITIDLTATATDPVLSIDPAFPYDFGQVLAGNQFGPVTVTLTNTGNGTLLLYSVKAMEGFDTAFLLLVPETDFPVALRPESETGDSFSFYVYFAPQNEIDYSGNIVLETDDYDSSSYTLQFMGKGGKCPSGFYDYDDDPSDCEYECHFSTSSPELCNQIDDNCDGQTDEGFNIGNLCSGIGICPDGYLECDPEDSSKTICNTNPGGSHYNEYSEMCNNLDDDCDGFTDEDYFVGESCEGKGECGSGKIECYGAVSTRCSTERGGTEDQTADEVCDEKDNDCDGLTDEDYSTGGTCNGVGVCGDGVWECAGENDVICSTLPGGSEYPEIAPEELCDRLDNDCDGSTDEDWNTGQTCLGEGQCGLGFIECATLRSSRCSTNPGGSEYPSYPPEDLCDGLDNDCDGFTDEDYLFDVVEADCSTDADCDSFHSCDPVSGDCIADNLQTCDGVGECGIGVLECRSTRIVRCSTDLGGSEYPAQEPQELCDSLDNDCDGLTDEIFGVGTVCDGQGGCGEGVYECDGKYSTRCSTDMGGSQYDDPLVGGKDEICDNIDNDCDGSTDEGFAIGNSCDGEGECGTGYLQCDPNDTALTICSTEPNGNEPENTEELCDGLDNDCDGITDEVCRINIYRYVKEHISGIDYEYRLATLANAPAGFVLDNTEPLFALYQTQQANTIALMELTYAAQTDATYSADTDERADYVSNGWTENVILGYASVNITDDLLYRLNKVSVTAHNFSADSQEYIQLLADGFEGDMPALNIYVYPAFIE